MTKSNYKQKILRWFEENAESASSELLFSSPYELIVAVILSAQCTDTRVNMITPALFQKYPDISALAKARVKTVANLIKSVSYPNSKASHLVSMAKMVIKDFGGIIPSETDDLIKLPGVGRKTANVVASICFEKPVVAVDTHVYRVAHRMGLSTGKTPYKVEMDLERLIPAKKRGRAHHWLILHGRYVCKSIKPNCSECGVERWCPKLMEGSKLSTR